MSTTSITVEYDLPHAPKKVWRALTEPDLLAKWLMDNDFSAQLGHRFEFKKPSTQWDGVVKCEVLALEPEKKLSYTWRGNTSKPEGDPMRLDTIVTWTLSPTPSGGTLLRLEHSGFSPQNSMALDGLGKGWRGLVGQRLQDLLAQLSS